MKFKEIVNVLCIPREDKEEFKKVCKEWEELTLEEAVDRGRL